MAARVCLSCGMALSETVRVCPKCDNELDNQTDGSIITVDIAHNGEKPHQALRKLSDLITDALKGNAQYLRFIVGNGVIREEALVSLSAMERRQTIRSFSEDGANRGALLVRLLPCRRRVDCHRCPRGLSMDSSVTRGRGRRAARAPKEVR